VHSAGGTALALHFLYQDRFAAHPLAAFRRRGGYANAPPTTRRYPPQWKQSPGG